MKYYSLKEERKTKMGHEIIFLEPSFLRSSRPHQRGKWGDWSHTFRKQYDCDHVPRGKPSGLFSPRNLNLEGIIQDKRLEVKPLLKGLRSYKDKLSAFVLLGPRAAFGPLLSETWFFNFYLNPASYSRIFYFCLNLPEFLSFAHSQRNPTVTFSYLLYTNRM